MPNTPRSFFRHYSADMIEVEKEVNVKRMYEQRDLSEDYLIRPGDMVFVPKSAFSKIAPFIPRPSFGIFISPIG